MAGSMPVFHPPNDLAAPAEPGSPIMVAPLLPKSSPRRRNLSWRSREGRTSWEAFPVENLERSGSTPVASYPSRRSDSVKLGSQREISDDEARLVYINDPERTNQPLRFVDNSIRTAKYSVLTFLPRNLFEQFHRVAYVYFLVLVGLNQIPQLGVFTPAASVLPLAFVLGVTAVKDAYEDWRRHLSDRTENSRTAQVLVAGGEFRPKRWKDIVVGEVVKVAADETLPCDMVLLATSDPTGVAYVQTINLDGESNLKSRYAKQETQSTSPEAMSGLIRCEKPNRNIYGFLGGVDVPGSKRVSLGPANIILRGCELKNTSWVVGVAVYTGQETKVMLNSSGTPSKRSRLEAHMNREVILLAVALITLCSIVTILAGVWLTNHRDELDDLPYYRKEDFSGAEADTYDYHGVGLETLFSFLKSVIIFQVMIPIALYISMELVRLGQAFLMTQDKNMFDEGSKTSFQCRALNINEDLGQIKYVFSDKTGTLTENKMEFLCASVGGVDYSGGEEEAHSISVAGETWRPKMTVKTDPELMNVMMGGKGTEKAKQARDFFLALATCNTIVPILVDTSDPSLKLIDYQGESPDEQALVYAAAAYGFTLLERTSGHIVIHVLGESQRYDVLGLHEFDSDRKRMSVVIGCPDKTVKLFVKGADNSMFGVIQKGRDLDVIRATQTNLLAYSFLGLRTLVVGMRELSKSEFKEWQSAFENANAALIGRGKLLRALASNVERNLHILGASGIEDKLQQGVPEAIESMRQAGIKVWVLTGDKQETAVSIGFSCKLLTNDMTRIVINSNSRESCKNSLQDAVSMSSKLAAVSPGPENILTGTGSSRVPLALIIDGTSLIHILEKELEDELFKVAIVCDVVLCCRVAPLQKAGIVALIKNRTDDMTLAIGDGANDVSMIQMADVGIGISGQEGRQAVMASDFSMGQFRFLVPLLLVHGHWNYQRMAYMILYNFYRNAVLVFILFWYVLYTAYSLTAAISDWNTQLYSFIYTTLPTIVVGILDKDLSRKTLLKYPQLYKAGQRDERYNLRLFMLTMMDSIWQSVAIFYIPYIAYRHSDVDVSGLGDLWIIAVVLLVNLHLAMDVFRWNWITHASIWGCIIATVICVIILDSIWMLPGYWAIFNMMGTGLFWVCLLGIIVSALVPRFTTKVLTEYVIPSDVQIAREHEKIQNLSTATTSEILMNTFSQS
ncbi:phospholipid-transporting ATPase 1-like [Musa acuminata AAA Group]|uniref:phospholipid-transporting ATPase 1-like n=1 Tax=Musa acuminata AAA Group TaxID=214697 RepID=UPI0031CED6F3